MWINFNMSNGRKSYMSMIRVLGEVMCLAWLVFISFSLGFMDYILQYINLRMVSGWICRHPHMQTGCCPAPTKKAVSAKLCQAALGVSSRSSSFLFHVVVCSSAPLPRNMIHLPTLIVKFLFPCLPGSDMSSPAALRYAQTILVCEIRSLMSLLIH